jgi:hypothetical protein
MTNLSTYPSLVWAGEMWRRGRGNRRSIAELEACPPRDRIARDVGLSDSDLRALSCRYSGASGLMPQRLAQLGLDPAYVKLARSATYQDLQRVCAACKAWRRCARDLSNGDVQVGMRSYCLNSGTIDALTIDRLPKPAGNDRAAFTVIQTLLDKRKTWP